MKLFRFIILLLIIGFGSIYWINVKSDANSEKLSSPEKTTVSKEPEFYSNEILVKFKNNSKTKLLLEQKSIDENAQALINSLSKLQEDNKITKVEKIIQDNESGNESIYRWYKITLNTKKLLLKGKFNTRSNELEVLSNSLDFTNSLAILKKDNDIDNAEPNYIIQTDSVTPNDPYYIDTASSHYQRDPAWNPPFDYMWGMKKINAAGGWNIATGSGTMIVAHIDSGVDITHPDLSANIWTNSAEIAGNGIDDDNNGKIDDINGWNFYSNTNNISDDFGHGTHTAGTIGAVGNNGIGVVGVAWNVKIMPLKIFNASGFSTADGAAQAFKYASDKGAKISSNSWVAGNSAILDDAIDYAYKRGMVIVMAAGNSSIDLLDSPLGTTSGDIIFVGSTDNYDARSTFSNYGSHVDVFAPGENILSTRPSQDTYQCSLNNQVNSIYCYLSGTSMSTPHVAGLAALIRMTDPALSREQVRQVIRMWSDDIGTPGWDSTYGYGRINVGASLSAISPRPPAPFISYPYTKSVIHGTAVQITGSISGVNAHGYKLEYGLGRDPQTWTLISQSTTVPSNGIFGTLDTEAINDGLYQFRLSTTDAAGKSFEYRTFDVKVQNFLGEITAPNTIINSGTITINGTADLMYAPFNFLNYKIEWADTTTQPLSYSTSGITLTNGGTQYIDNGTLGTWDTAALTHGHTYSLRLTIESVNHSTGTSTIQVVYDKNLLNGWPLSFDKEVCAANICNGVPVFADLLDDGQKELIIAAPSNKIYAYKKDGTLLSGFPASVDYNYFFSWPPAVSDIDQDGKKEIIAYGISSDFTQAKVYIIKSDGTSYTGWTPPTIAITHPTSDGVVNQGFNASPAVVDLNNDGSKEIVYLDTSQKKIHAYKANGTELTGFPKTISSIDAAQNMTAVSVADMDNNGSYEIGFGNGTKLYLLDSSGNTLTGFPVSDSNFSTNYIKTSPAFGDVDNDGKLDMVIGTQGASNDPVEIYAYKKTGALISGFPQAGGAAYTQNWPLNSLSTADLDSDGKDDIVSGVEHLSIHRQSGVTSFGTAYTSAAPAISDIAGDSVLRFIVPSSGLIKILNQDGTTWWTNAAVSDDKTFSDPAVVADMDNDGNMEVAAVKTNSISSSNTVYLWTIPGNGLAKKEWPLYQHDSLHSGYVDRVIPNAAITLPTNFANVSGIYQITATASDNIEVNKVEFYVDNALYATSKTYPYKAAWDTTVYANASLHTIYAKSYDLLGNLKQSTTISNVKITDITPPTVSITSPANGATVTKGAVTIVTATAADVSGIAKIEFRMNNILKCTDNTAPYSCNWTVPTTGSNYTIEARAYDTANKSALTTIQVTAQ